MNRINLFLVTLFLIVIMLSCSKTNSYTYSKIQSDRELFNFVDSFYLRVNNIDSLRLFFMGNEIVENCDYYDLLIYDSSGSRITYNIKDTANFFQDIDLNKSLFSQDRNQSYSFHRDNQIRFSFNVYRPRNPKEMACDLFTEMVVQVPDSMKDNGKGATYYREIVKIRKGYYLH